MASIFKEYRIHRISKERLPDLIGLFRNAFNNKKSLSYLTKKFDTERFGASFIGYIAYTEEGEPAAFYGVFPIRFKLNNRIILAAQSGDTMTHKNHQRKGLFIELARMTYDLARREGIELIFGFPYENTIQGFIRKLGWTIDGELREYKLIVYTIPLAALMYKLGLKSLYDLYFRLCAKLFGLVDKPSLSIIDRNNSIYYDKDGIEYRCFSKNYFLEDKCSLIWIKSFHTMEIGCIFNADDEHATRLLSRLKCLAIVSGQFRISFWCTGNHPNLRVFQSHFKQNTGAHYGHLHLTATETQHNSFFYEACDADTY